MIVNYGQMPWNPYKVLYIMRSSYAYLPITYLCIYILQKYCQMNELKL